MAIARRPLRKLCCLIAKPRRNRRLIFEPLETRHLLTAYDGQISYINAHGTGPGEATEAAAFWFGVIMSEPTTEPLTLHYSFTDLTATGGQDYNSIGGDLIIPPGFTPGTMSVYSPEVPVSIYGDFRSEGDESFQINVWGDDYPENPGLSASTLVTIHDTIPPQLNVGDVIVTQQTESATFPISYVSAIYPYTVAYRTQDGTAIAGQDYDQSSGEIDIPNSWNTTSITLPVHYASDTHGTFSIVLSDPHDPDLIIATAQCTLDNAPSATDDSFAGIESAPLIVSPLQSILLNDSDPENDQLSARLVQGPTQGSVTLNTDGSFTYVPSEGYIGNDAFTYEVNDGHFNSEPATVSLSIEGRPIAHGDYFRTGRSTTLVVPAPGVLTNDTDPESDQLTAVLCTNCGAAHGVVALNSDGGFQYVPDANFRGLDYFAYTVTDSHGAQSSAWVQITVNATIPVAHDDSYSTDEDTLLTVGDHGPLANDSDADGDQLNIIIASNPTHGTVRPIPGQDAFEYTPSANYNGADSFTYYAYDAVEFSNAATVSLNVRPVNDRPVAVNDTFACLKNASLTISAASLLANDSDVDGDALTMTIVNGPSHGTLTPTGSGTFLYSPTAGYTGPDSFTYKANDGLADSNIATVSINVTLPDISLNLYSFHGDFTNYANLQIDYVVSGVSSGPYSIAVYASSDGTTLDRELWRHAGSTELGSYTLSFLPSYDDWQGDYYLIAVVDPDHTLAESNEGNNSALVCGPGAMFLATEPNSGKHVLQIQGTDAPDVVSMTYSTGAPTVRITMNSHSHDYSLDAIDEIHFRGHGGNDNFIGTYIATPAWLFGGNGSDTLNALAGPDFISGGAGDDHLWGGWGDDDLSGDDGNDTIDGFDGKDTITGGSGDDTITGGSGDDTIYGNDGNDAIDGDDGDDNLSGGNGDDTINGGEGDDTITGDAGTNILNGDAGNDKIYGSANDTINLGDQGGDQSFPSGATDINGNPCIFAAPGYEWHARPPIPLPQSDLDGQTETIELYRPYPWKWANDIHVRIDVIDGTAVNGVDFDAPTSTTLDIPNSLNDPYHTPVWPTFTITWLPDEDGVIEDQPKTFTLRYTVIEREPCGDVQEFPIPVADRTIIAVDDYAEFSPNSSVLVSPTFNDLSNVRPIHVQSFGQPSHGHVERAVDHPDDLLYTPENGYDGEDEFEYTDSNGYESDSALVFLEDRGIHVHIGNGQQKNTGEPKYLGEGKGDGHKQFDINEGTYGRGGAFTLANQNDTDNDGRPDDVDSDVRSWTTSATANLNTGVFTIRVESVEGFQVGDAISIIQMATGKTNPPGYEANFDRAVISNIDVAQKTITISTALSRDYEIDSALGKTIKVTHGGRNEVDLMPLNIRLVDIGNPQGNVVIQAPSWVQLWTQPYKGVGNEVTRNANGSFVIPASEAASADGKRLWVELLGYSMILGDTRITATYQGNTDFVDATGIGVDDIEVKHDSTDTPWSGAPGNFYIPTPPFGLPPLTTLPNNIGVHIGNEIGFRYQLLPEGIWDQPELKFDIGRQIQWREWDKTFQSSNWFFWDTRNKEFPYIAEQANDDDPRNRDDERGPDSNGYIYSLDWAGPFARSEPFDNFAYAHVLNGKEFVRVAIGAAPNEIPANNVWGSEASTVFNWHDRLNVALDSGTLKRTTGNASETAENDIGPGHVPLTRPGL